MNAWAKIHTETKSYSEMLKTWGKTTISDGKPDLPFAHLFHIDDLKNGLETCTPAVGGGNGVNMTMVMHSQYCQVVLGHM